MQILNFKETELFPLKIQISNELFICLETEGIIV